MDFGAITRIVSNSYGPDLSTFDPSFLVQSINRRLTATSIGDVADYGKYLADNSAEVQELISSLNVCYSTFFRNPIAMALLEQMVLPDLVERKVQSGEGTIRIWSAGCAAGQEPYSIAILLQEVLALTGKPVTFQIFATDVSESALAAAAVGQYASADVQNVPLKYINKYLVPQGDFFQIDQCLRQKVSFSQYDLLDLTRTCPPESIYGHFDIVLCSNVLFYYSAGIQQRILRKIAASMVSGGYLVVGKAERGLVDGARVFCPVEHCSTIFQRRGDV
jgi:chemotaxis methyl-accepting protein methylase